MIIGYARVSTRDQNLSMQIDALNRAGCEKIYQEKQSGTKGNREQLIACMKELRAGDTLVVYKLDRLGRTLKIIVDLLDNLGAREVDFISLSDNINTSGPSGKLMFNIIAAFAQYERDILVERTQEGRRIARNKGVKFGRPTGSKNIKTGDKVASVVELYKAGTSISRIRKILSIGSIETVYRYLKEYDVEPNRRKK